jgi:pimeloyl-ACP methyl ester carboxylesterase
MTHPIESRQSGGDRWEFVEGGAGDSTLAILPGGGGSPESMFTVNLATEPFARVISLGVPATVKTVRQAVSGIDSVLGSNSAGRVFVLGHSLGGMLAQALAASVPDRIAGLILSNTGFYLGARARAMPLATRLMSRLSNAMLVRGVEAQMTRLLQGVGERDFWSAFYREEIGRPDSAVRLRGQLRLMTDCCNHFRENPLGPGMAWTRELPVLVIASEDDRGFTRRETNHLCSIYARCRTELFPAGTGHLSFLTRPKEYNDLVQRFLVEEAGGAR